MAAVHWYIARNGQKVGPFTPAELRQLAVVHLLQPNEMVWTEGVTRWVEAGSLPWLFPPAGQKRYWLHLAGQTRGPYAADQIRAALTARQITVETLACPEGGKDWAPLRQAADFQDYTPPVVTPSQARLLSGSLDVEEAELHLAGKQGDLFARLISTLLDLKKTHAENVSLVATLDRSIEVLRTKRAETAETPATSAKK
jgi:hypothetical protein